MNLAEDYFYKNNFSDEILSKNSENLKNTGQIIFFPVVFRRHHTFNDPINLIDSNGLFAVEIGGSIGAFFGGGLGIGGGISGGGVLAVNNTNLSQVEIGTAASVSIRNFGAGVSGGASGYVSVTPFANSVNDLNGGFGGIGVDVGPLSASITFSSSGPTLTFGAGPGIPGLSVYSIAGVQQATPSRSSVAGMCPAR